MFAVAVYYFEGQAHCRLDVITRGTCCCTIWLFVQTPLSSNQQVDAVVA